MISRGITRPSEAPRNSGDVATPSSLSMGKHRGEMNLSGMPTLSHQTTSASQSASSPSARLSQRLNATICRWLGACREWVAEKLKVISGEVQFSTSVHRRGHLGLDAVCNVCRADVHDLGEMCPLQWTGQCDICGPVLLDFYRNCSADDRAHRRTHVIDYRTAHPTTPDEWRRLSGFIPFLTPERRSYLHTPLWGRQQRTLHWNRRHWPCRMLLSNRDRDRVCRLLNPRRPSADHSLGTLGRFAGQRLLTRSRRNVRIVRFAKKKGSPMADQKETYGAESKFTGFWVAPENLIIAGLDCSADEVPDVADPDRLDIDIEDLALNVAKHGVREPVTIKKYAHLPRAVVVAGRRRVRAARLANESLNDDQKVLVPCISEKGDAFTTMVLENEHRVNDTPLARARKARRMQERGATDKAIAIAFGVSVSAVKFWWKLLEAPAKVQRAVEREQITASVAAEIAAMPPDAQAQALTDAIEQGRGNATLENVRATRKAISKGESSAPRRLPAKKVKTFYTKLTEVSEPDPHVELARDVLSFIHSGDVSVLQKYPSVASVFGGLHA